MLFEIKVSLLKEKGASAVSSTNTVFHQNALLLNESGFGNSLFPFCHKRGQQRAR